MTTTDATSRISRLTFSAMVHLRWGVKLGSGLAAMLFPTAAFDDAQGQEEKEEGEREVQYYGPGVHNPAGEIVHLVKESQRGECLALPIRLRLQMAGQEPEQNQAPANDQSKNGRDHLAARQGRRAATQRHKHAAEQQQAEERAGDATGIQG